MIPFSTLHSPVSHAMLSSIPLPLFMAVRAPRIFILFGASSSHPLSKYLFSSYGALLLSESQCILNVISLGSQIFQKFLQCFMSIKSY